MKLDTKVITPDGKRALVFRANAPELEVLYELVKLACMHTPKTKANRDTIERLKSIRHGFNSDVVQEWLKEKDV